MQKVTDDGSDTSKVAVGSEIVTDSIDDTIEINPRPVEDLARRTTLLVTLIRRALLETPDDTDDTDTFARETDRFELYSWARREFMSIITGDERSVLESPVGELGLNAINWCLSASIPARALLWALNAQHSLSPADTPAAEMDILMGWAPEPWEEFDRLARRNVRRPEEELAQERERWELWYWRATLTAEDVQPGETLRDTVAEVARDAERADLINVVENDFAVEGRPFSLLSPDEQDRAAELAEGYLIALNWVCGIGASWEDVPLYAE